jgi:hypothetical protein
MNNGSTGSIEAMNKFIENQTVKLNLMNDNSISMEEEATLREYRGDLYEQFNDYHNRPSNKYKRKLCISILRNDEGIFVSLGVDEYKMSQNTLWDKLMWKFK